MLFSARKDRIPGILEGTGWKGLDGLLGRKLRPSGERLADPKLLFGPRVHSALSNVTETLFPGQVHGNPCLLNAEELARSGNGVKKESEQKSEQVPWLS